MPFDCSSSCSLFFYHFSHDEAHIRYGWSIFILRLHVRRTDKSKEAGHRSLDEYMVYVAEWYDAYELTHPNVERRVYLATDESTLIKEAMLR